MKPNSLLSDLENITDVMESYPVTVGQIRAAIVKATSHPTDELDRETALKAISNIRYQIAAVADKGMQVGQLQSYLFSLEAHVDSLRVVK
jgi:hypothetical protein